MQEGVQENDIEGFINIFGGYEVFCPWIQTQTEGV
jgi:hypothetical protein